MLGAKGSSGYLKPSEVAKLLRVEPGTVRLWAQSGRLRASVTPGGHRRFDYRDVVDFARRNGLTLARPPSEELRVLIVDDDAEVRGLMQRMLTSVEPPVVTEAAADGFSAGQRLAQFAPDVIVLDLYMPGVDGFELCEALKADPQTAGIRIVAITGAQHNDAPARVLELGAETCLIKPFRRAKLLEAVGVTAAPRPETSSD